MSVHAVAVPGAASETQASWVPMLAIALAQVLQAQVDLDSLNFVSNDHLQEVLARTTATPEQVAEAVRVNTEARLRALKMRLLLMALLSILPAARLPRYRPGELAPAESPHGGGDGAP
jgi:hypothetical protein